jgi:SAM-dependent methyltransferase
MIARLKAAMPWQLKIAGKVMLARLPVSYSGWSRLQLFKHGAMADVAYAEGVFRKHYDTFRTRGGAASFVCVELGPGDSLLSAPIARRHGAVRAYLVDAGAFARTGAAFYRDAAPRLEDGGGASLSPNTWLTVDAMLADCKAAYLTGGLASLRTIPDASVDFIWSQAVLEHVRRAELAPTIAELRRILRPAGLMSHQVDLRDHLGGRLNNLRFGEKAWEGPVLSASGFYTNRLRFSEILEICHREGFNTETTEEERWSTLPTPRSKFNQAFRHLEDRDLLVFSFRLVAVPR